MSPDLHLKPQCGKCGSTTLLYGSNCKHLTLCLSCGKKMAEAKAQCFQCGVPVTHLIREYNLKAGSCNDKDYFIGKFSNGVPDFKKIAGNKLSLHKEGLKGRQVTDALREKYKNKPWVLEDKRGQTMYHGQLEGAQTGSYYLLMVQGKEITTIPAGSWYNFNKVAQYKQLTLEEAEDKIKNRRKNADGYQRWMMKVANNGAAAFGEKEKPNDKDNVGASGKMRSRATLDDDEAFDMWEADEEEEESKSGLNKKGGNGDKEGGDDDEEGPRGGDYDSDGDDIYKGADWEHEENFTDDDEAVGIELDECEDIEPAPPEIKEDEEDDSEANEGGGLSQSGKELKKLLGLYERDADNDDEDSDNDDINMSPVLAPKNKDEAKVQSVPGSAGGTISSSKSSNPKRKSGGEDVKISKGGATKKVKSENKGSIPLSSKTDSTPSADPVTEDEIRDFLLQKAPAPMTVHELSSRFKGRFNQKEGLKRFSEMLKKVAYITKIDDTSYIFLADK